MNENQDAITQYYSWGSETHETSKSRPSDEARRNIAYTFTANYDRTFGKHSINALVTYFQQKQEKSYLLLNFKRQNIGGLVNYMYDNKYTGEVSVNRTGGRFFRPRQKVWNVSNRWCRMIASEESFMKKLSWIDYLKVRASYGILGSTTYTADGLFDSYLYRDVWNATGTYNVSGFNNIAVLKQSGNPNVGFQKSYEFNAGIDFNLLHRSLSGSFGYFHNTLDGALVNMSDMTSGVSGKNGVLMMQNYNQYITSDLKESSRIRKK